MGQIAILKRYKANGKRPSVAMMKYGDVAINYAKDNEAIYIKNDNGEIVDLSRSEDIKTLNQKIDRIQTVSENEINNIIKQ